MTKKASRIIAAVLTVLAVIFIAYALNNPQASFPWSNTVTYVIYLVYFIVTVLLYIAPFKRK